MTELTSDHYEIQAWARKYGASPASVLPTTVDGVKPTLTFMFRSQLDSTGQTVSITWEEFFLRFDLMHFQFIGEDSHEGATPTFALLLDPLERVILIVPDA